MTIGYGVAGGEVVGDDDVFMVRAGVRGGGGVLAEVAQDALANVVDVGGAFAEVGVVDAPHGFDEVLHHGEECVFRILAAVFDGFVDFVDQDGVFEHHQVGVENLAVLFAGEIADVAA